MQSNAAESGQRSRRAAWALPLAGVVATWLVVAGISLSNVDIRREAEALGLIALAAFALLGFVMTRRAGAPRAAVFVNLLLAALVATLAAFAYAARHPPTPLLALSTVSDRVGSASNRVWIDLDPACGSGKAADVDDCWALAFALRSPELRVIGISTVFGNRPRAGPLSSSQRVALARSIVELAGTDTAVFAGSEEAGGGQWRSTPAFEALSAQIATTPLTIVSLGPATNIAALLARHPDRARGIARIIMVAGKPPGRLFHPGRHWWFHFGDFNVSSDVEAMQTVLRSGIPITLVPFELAVQISITRQDIDRLRAGDRLGKWVADSSEAWLSFWEGTLIDRSGFSPFDAIAVGYAALPHLFECRDTRARIGFSVFLAPLGLGSDLEVADDRGGVPVRYCHTIDARFKSILLERLASPAMKRQSGDVSKSASTNPASNMKTDAMNQRTVIRYSRRSSSSSLSARRSATS